MKKFLVISILLIFSFSAAFAQEEDISSPRVMQQEEKASDQNTREQRGWVFSGEIQVSTDAIHFTKASGKIETVTGGDKDVDEWGKNIDGSLTLLNSSIGPAPSFWSAIYINYFGENIEFGIQVDLWNFFKRGGGEGVGGGGSLLTGTSVKWLDVLNAGFNEWYLKGNVGIFDGYVGNTGYGGFVEIYDVYTDWLNKDHKIENFYINKMGDRQVSNNMSLWNFEKSAAFAMGTTFMDSFRFAFGTAFGYGGNIGNVIETSYAFENPYASANAINAGAMFSGKKIADLVNFDVFYGIFGYDKNTNARGEYNIKAPDLETQAGGAYQNVFGVYGGMSFGDLGISFGYSGDITIYEKQHYNKSADPAKPDYHTFNLLSPLWSSVHLHANYAILKNLRLTFSNNISFAGVKSVEIKDGEDYNSITLGLADGGIDSKNTYKTFAGKFTGHNKGEEESWFGYNAALQASYDVTPAFNLCFQIGNQLGVYSYSREKFTSSRSSNHLAAVINTQYSINNVTVGAGLSFGLETTAYSAKTEDDTIDGVNNIFKIGIPIIFKVVF